LIKDPKGYSKGYCYVDFQSEEDIQMALEMDGKIIQGKKIYVARSKPTIKRDERTLYLGNLSFNSDES